ncbi:hypothetical protein BsWGS_14796 [Bradybaena similaris]
MDLADCKCGTPQQTPEYVLKDYTDRREYVATKGRLCQTEREYLVPRADFVRQNGSMWPHGQTLPDRKRVCCPKDILCQREIVYVAPKTDFALKKEGMWPL